MKDVILQELVKRWDQDANFERGNVAVPDTEEQKIKEYIAEGIRRGKRECADGLRTLIEVLRLKE